MSISMCDGTPIAVPRWKDEAVESSIFHATIRYVALGNIGEIVALQHAALVRSHATSACTTRETSASSLKPMCAARLVIKIQDEIDPQFRIATAAQQHPSTSPRALRPIARL